MKSSPHFPESRALLARRCARKIRTGPFKATLQAEPKCAASGIVPTKIRRRRHVLWVANFFANNWKDNSSNRAARSAYA